MNGLALVQRTLQTGRMTFDVMSNNINNTMNPDYCRRSVVISEAPGINTANGFVGQGVQIETIQRINDECLNSVVRHASSYKKMVESDLLSSQKIDGIFLENKKSLSEKFNAIFTPLSRIPGQLNKNVLCEETIAQLNMLCNELNRTGETLDEIRLSTLNHISSSISNINTYAKDIASLNKEIGINKNVNHQLSLELADRRDMLINKISEEVGVKAVNDLKTGNIDIFLEQGFPLVSGEYSYTLSSQLSYDDAVVPDIYYHYNETECSCISRSAFSFGNLSGYLHFMHNTWSSTNNHINNIAFCIADKFNHLNLSGYKHDGSKGSEIFIISPANVQKDKNNIGNAVLKSNSLLSGVENDYAYTFIVGKNNRWEIIRNNSAAEEYEVNNSEIIIDNMTLVLEGNAIEGDHFYFNPFDRVASTLRCNKKEQLAIYDEQKNNGEESDVLNQINKFMNIKSSSINKKGTLMDNYMLLVTSVGNETFILHDDFKTAEKKHNELNIQKMSSYGVDQINEQIEMMGFVKYYQANMRILKTTCELFDEILRIH